MFLGNELQTIETKLVFSYKTSHVQKLITPPLLRKMIQNSNGHFLPQNYCTKQMKIVILTLANSKRPLHLS